MVDVKGVTSEEVIELMAQQPLALRKRITETLQDGVAGDREAVDWIEGTPESRMNAVRRLVQEALDNGKHQASLRRDELLASLSG